MFNLKNVCNLIKYRSFHKSSQLNKLVGEIINKVNPYSKIKIIASHNLKVIPYDLINCPNSNILRIKNANNELLDDQDVKIKITDDNIEINSYAAKAEIVVEVPVKAFLSIETTGNIKLKNVHSDFIDLIAGGNIETKNLRSIEITLNSKNGNIYCNGLTLAQNINITTLKNGIISLDKIQGDFLHASTYSGELSTNSCYVNSSIFQTNFGNLLLHNVHKNAEIDIVQKGRLEMTGFHGTLNAKVSSGEVKVQFSEISDKNLIVYNGTEPIEIYISDLIQENSFVDINSKEIEVDESITTKSGKYIFKDNFLLGQSSRKNTLSIESKKGLVKLGKMSWADSLKLKMLSLNK